MKIFTEFTQSSLNRRQSREPNQNIGHSIRFFEMTKLMKLFLSSICGKNLEPDWEQNLDAFKSSAVEYFRECAHIGKFK